MIFYQNIDEQTGLPGMSRVLWAPLNAIVSAPVLPATGTTPGQTDIAVGDFTFSAGNGWIDFKNDLLKGAEIEWKSIGDAAGPGSDAVLKGRTLGMTSQLFEQFNNMLGMPGIALVKDGCSDNRWWVVGCACDPAFFTFDFKTGAKGGNDVKGTSFEFKSAQGVYLYQGAITMRLASVSGGPFRLISSGRRRIIHTGGFRKII